MIDKSYVNSMLFILFLTGSVCLLGAIVEKAPEAKTGIQKHLETKMGVR